MSNEQLSCAQNPEQTVSIAFKVETMDRKNTVYPEILRLYSALGERRSSFIRDKLDALLLDEDIFAIFVHGSFSRIQADEHSDLDVIVVAEDCTFERQITAHRQMLEADEAIAVYAHTDRFPWFGHLETAIYPGPNWFSLEIGFVQHSELGKFYVEPDAWIIKDRDSAVLNRRKACLAERITKAKMERSNLGYELLNLGIKFEKAIKRNHLWNAHNYCSVARRILFDIERRKKYGDNKIFVGVSERRIESELDDYVIRGLENSAPRYCDKELTDAFLFLFDTILQCARCDIDDKLLRWISAWREYAEKLVDG